MKNIAIVNSCDWGSTGKISKAILKDFISKGYNAYFYYGRGGISNGIDSFRFENKFEIRIHALLSRITGLQGWYSRLATKRLIKYLINNSIDTVFLLSPHGYYLCEKYLYDYIIKSGIRLIYIMIDEYAYLGKCGAPLGCSNYKNYCKQCPKWNKYPESWFFDRSYDIFQMKLHAYSKMKNVLFVGPEFVVNNAKQSPLGDYMNLQILDEAIDLDLYKPVETIELRRELGIKEHQIVFLCVAPAKDEIKGARFFVEAAKFFADNDKMVFIHIGYNNNLSYSNKNFIPIEYIKNDGDLVKYYSMADLFVFPSLADTMSNTCIEALACGTPLLCFNISGMPYLLDETVGTLIPPQNVDSMINEIKKTVKKDDATIQTCRRYAEKRYDKKHYSDKLIKIVSLL